MPSKALPIAAVLFIAASDVAHAGYRKWNYQCTMGAFTACASVAIWTTYDPTTESTAIRVRLANLRGSVNWLQTSGPYYLNSVEFRNVIAEGPVHEPQGNIGTGIRDPHVGDGLLVNNAETNGFWGSPESGSPPRLNIGWYGIGGIFGCDGNPDGLGGAGGGPYPEWMCGGYVDYTFTFSGRWEVTDQTTARLAFGAAGGYDPDDGRGIYCTTDVDCVTVTPEPITLVLLGSGLAGLGGAGMMRRRKKGELT